MSASESRPTLFIGSSSEGLPVARSLAAQLSSDAVVTVWDKGVFGLGSTVIETLDDAIKEFDFAVLVFTPDDRVTSRHHTRPVARDNVLFECGLFMGAIGRKRTFIAFQRDNEPTLPSDLLGIIEADFTDAESMEPAASKIRSRISDFGKRQPDPPPFWRPFIRGGCRIVIGGFTEEFRQWEPSGLVGGGDAACLAELSAHLRGTFRFDAPVEQADAVPQTLNGYATDLIALGGADTNSTTRELLRRIRTSLTFGNSQRNEISFHSSRTQRDYAPEWNGPSVAIDYGIIICSHNPFAAEHSILLVFGCYGYGTRAAGRFVCSDEFLRLAEVDRGDNFECVVQTEVLGGAAQRASLCEIHPLDASNIRAQ